MNYPHFSVPFLPQPARQPMCFSPAIRDNMELARRSLTMDQVKTLFGPAKTLGAPREHQIAMDAAFDQCGAYDLIQHQFQMGLSMGAGTPGFLGYAFLSTLTQNGLIRAGVETVADEMTRKWVELKGSEAEDDYKIKQLTEDMEKFGLQSLFNKAAAQVGYFGGCLAYIDVEGVTDTTAPLILNRATFRPGSLRGFRLVEPINVYPGRYNASDPMSEAYFNPQTWWVLGKEYHRSRFLYFTANEMPLLLRPSYNFFGLPMAQLALDYVGHFTETREAAARLLTKFSLTAFKTNLSATLSGGGAQDIDARMAWFIQNQNNNGCFVVDKETEDIVKLDTSLGGVVDIPRQSLELLSAIFRVPAVKLLGISPAGFNATGEGDLRNYYDHAAAQQQKILKQPLNRATDVLMCNIFGEVDQTISADFVKPGDDDPKYVAEVQKMRADTDAVFVDRGIIGQEEVRARLAADPSSGYSGIDVDNVPEQPSAGLGDINDTDEAGRVWG